MNEENRFTYAEISGCTGFNEILFNNADEFSAYAEKNRVSVIFRMKAESNISGGIFKKGVELRDDFLFTIGNTVYRLPSLGFKKLEDYSSAIVNKFPDSATFYEAMKGGFTSFREFEESKKVGVDEKEIFLKAKKTGFIEGYDSFKLVYERLLKEPYVKGLDEGIDSAMKLYKYATRKGFSNYSVFSEAINNGFTEYLVYVEAKGKGFTKAHEYSNAVKTGFDSHKEYSDANIHSIFSKKEYNQYLSFKKNVKDDMGYDEFQLTEILKAKENGNVFTLEEVKGLLNEAQDKYKRTTSNGDERKLPLWYRKKIDNDDSLKMFLTENEKMKRIGFYDPVKESIEIYVLSKEKIYIDASNVAFNSNENRSNKPKLINIKYVVDELMSRGYNDITIIADASLSKAAEDRHVLDELPKEVLYLVAPPDVTADEFLIDNAKKDKCLIITNDLFRDWKKKDKWIEINIDKIRVSFVLKDARVRLAGLDRLETV
jgi:hypothetical protein